MGLSGNLKTMPFADLLQFICTNQNTGTLQIRNQQIVKMIFFEKGRIISSSSSDPKDYLGHFLVSLGLINEEELRIAMEVQRSSKMLLGKILVMSGKISEAEMVKLLRIKSEEVVYSLFLWDEGDFTFYHDEFINRLFVRISLDPQSLIFEGVMRRDEWQRIRAVFPNNSVLLQKVADTDLDRASVDSTTARIYDLVNGIRTIDDIALAVHSVDYTVCRILFALYEAGYLSISHFRAQATPVKVKGGDFSFSQLVDVAKENLDKGRYEEALEILREIKLTTNGYQTKVAPLLEKAEKLTVKEICTKILPLDTKLEVLLPLDELAKIKLNPQEGFVLSRLDGNWDVSSILSITPMKEVDALRLLKKLIERGIIGQKGAQRTNE
jgi:hypothetical protein